MDTEQVFEDYGPRSETPMNDYAFCRACGGELNVEYFYGRMRQRCIACRQVQYTNPAPGVAVLVVDGDRFLLCRRSLSTSLQPGRWCLPGCHVEWNEDFLSAGIREAREEAGVKVEIESIITVYSYFRDPERHYLAVVLLARAMDGQPHGDGVETDAARWFSALEPLPELAFPGDRHIIERYFAAPFRGAPVDPRYARPG